MCKCVGESFCACTCPGRKLRCVCVCEDVCVCEVLMTVMSVVPLAKISSRLKGLSFSVIGSTALSTHTLSKCTQQTNTLPLKWPCGLNPPSIHSLILYLFRREMRSSHFNRAIFYSKHPPPHLPKNLNSLISQSTYWAIPPSASHPTFQYYLSVTKNLFCALYLPRFPSLTNGLKNSHNLTNQFSSLALTRNVSTICGFKSPVCHFKITFEIMVIMMVIY